MTRNNVVYLNNQETKGSPDYTEDRLAAKILVDRLMEYYHSRGFRNVKVWLEPEVQPSGRKFFYVRSNISFKVP